MLLNAVRVDHGSPQPSAWVQQWAHLIAPGGSVLDVACGSGRHVRWLSARGHRVTALDKDAQALAGLHDVAECVQADIESGPWPWADTARQFDCVLVTNYLWRPLLPTLLASLTTQGEGGVLIYETFADGQQHIGRPARPDFLLQPGELLRAAAGLRVVAYEDGFESATGSETATSDAGPGSGPGRCVQRVAAVHPRRASPPLRACAVNPPATR